MAKSVGLLTFHNAYNFGAVLQAFALQRTIESLGNTSMIIDYVRPISGTAYQFFHCRMNYGSIRRDLRVLSHINSHYLLRKRFSQFQKNHLVLTSKSYHSVNELRSEDHLCDIYVAGSDQVWQPNALDEDRGLVYYLDFVSSGRRVAYAPSFGITEMPAEYRERAAALMNKFDFLSAREDSGCRIINELLGREALHVLDPSLLLPASAYQQVAISPQNSEPCVLLYPMLTSENLNHIARKVSKFLKLPLVVVVPIYYDPKQYGFADRVVFNAGPSEFLGWFGNAAYVCTNSFHGLAFSLIYHKSFLTVPHATLGLNTRLESLLARVGLLSRQAINGDEFLINDPLLKPIDYSVVDVLLNVAIDESIIYLKQALS